VLIANSLTQNLVFSSQRAEIAVVLYRPANGDGQVLLISVSDASNPRLLSNILNDSEDSVLNLSNSF
jgi:hypothetical protein